MKDRDQLQEMYEEYINGYGTSTASYNTAKAIQELFGAGNVQQRNIDYANSLVGLINKAVNGEDVLDDLLQSIIALMVIAIAGVDPSYTGGDLADRFKAWVISTPDPIDLDDDTTLNTQNVILFVPSDRVPYVNVPWQDKGGNGLVVSTYERSSTMRFQVGISLAGSVEWWWRYKNPGGANWFDWQSIASNNILSNAEKTTDENYFPKTLQATGVAQSGVKYYRFAEPTETKTASNVDWSKAYTQISEQTLSGGVTVINYKRETPMTYTSGDLYEIDLEDVTDTSTISNNDPAWAISGVDSGIKIKNIVAAVASQTGTNKITLAQVYAAAYYKFSLAPGEGAVVSGKNTLATGAHSSAAGEGCVAVGDNQVVVGRFNENDTDAIFIAGNGEDDEHRSNAVVIYPSGDIIYDKMALESKKTKALLKTLNEEYIYINDVYIQGGCDFTSGVWYDSNVRCHTDYIPIDRFVRFIKPAGVRAFVHMYDAGKQHIVSYTFATHTEREYVRDTITSDNVKYLIFEIAIYEAATEKEIVPYDAANSGFVLYLVASPVSIETRKSMVKSLYGDDYGLQFESGTYGYITVGQRFVKYDAAPFNTTRKRLVRLPYMTDVPVNIHANAGCLITVLVSDGNLITAVYDRQTDFTLLPGNKYGVILYNENGTDVITDVPVSRMISVEYGTIAGGWKYAAEMELEGGSLMLLPAGAIGDTEGGMTIYRRSKKMARIHSSVEIVFAESDIAYIDGFSVWQYANDGDGVVFVSRVQGTSLIGEGNHFVFGKTDGVDYIKLTIVPTSAGQSHTFEPVKLYSDKTIEMCYNPAISGEDTGEISFSYKVADGVCTRGVLLLPPNYSVDGDPVPLHVYCHGTGGMTYWSSHINIMDESTYEIDSRKMLEYQTNEGFAVFDCFPWTNRYRDDDKRQISPFLLDIHERAYIEGIKYVCTRFNVDINSVCVSGLSLGGNLSHWFAHQTEIPVRAVAMMAPTSAWVSPMWKAFFLTKNSRARILEILRLEDAEGATAFIDTNEGYGDATVEAFVDSNLPSFAGMSPSGFVNGPTYRQVYEMSSTTLEPDTKPDWMDDLPDLPELSGNPISLPTIVEHPEYSTFSPYPVKFWQAFDDTNVNGYVNYTLFQWLLNGGTQAYWRTLPNGGGGHSATGYFWGDDRYADLSEKTERKTRLGVEYNSTDQVPVAQVEMIQFFCDCLGIAFDAPEGEEETT